MDIPRFNREAINPRFASGEIGQAFQSFVHELLRREYPDLHGFPAGGKDGAIDLVDRANGNLVVECKFVGNDESIEGRWKKVRNNFEKHLTDPTGPTVGQSQYSPWYSASDPISAYWFCVSAVFANDSQRRGLRESISKFFQELLDQYPHLSHLRGMSVEVLDWSDLSGKLQKEPQLMFRWFPGTRPRGLVPLEEATDVGTFRAYLTNAKLPYYSIADHLQFTPAPAGSSIADEESLLAALEDSQNTGLVISGKGGIGKSRLTLELGWLALSKGWSVMRVQSRLTEDALDQFAERLTADTKTLLLIDYIETQSDFGELIETINVLNDSHIGSLRYVAACRTAFYYRAIAGSERHIPVDLTPPPGSSSLDWFAGYRHKTVEGILAKSGLPTTEKYQTLCNNLPILAVFLSYLHTSGRSDELADLLHEVEFGRWVTKRIQLTFPDKNVARELALLIPLFPMAEGAANQFSEPTYRQIFDWLAADGWLENVPSSESGQTTWVTAHDLLADQILSAYARSIPNTTESFVAELLSLAMKTGCLSAALVSLQRVSDIPPLNAVRWLKVISEAIAANEAAWYDVRDTLIRTTLLSTSEKLTLLRSYERLWAGIEHDGGFQKALGWIARRVVKQEPISEEDRRTLIEWLGRTVPAAQQSNFVITWGLRIAPDNVKDTALAWIVNKPFLWQTHYLMAAWLDSGLDPQAIASYVQHWCLRFSHNFHLSFLVPAWLNAGGDKALVRDAIAKWLIEHGSNADANFVYSSWLTAGGDKALVEEAIAEWLLDHRSIAAARFLYDAWLDAGGDKALVRDAIAEWLLQHRSTVHAAFLFRSWLKAGGDRALVQEAISEWLIEHRTTPAAGFIYDTWLDAGGDKALVRDAIADWLLEHRSIASAQFVYAAWLDSGGDKSFVQQAISEWLIEHRTTVDARFVYDAWLDAGGDKALVRDAIAYWLLEHRNTAEASHVYKAWLDASGAKGVVRNGLRDWLSHHAEDDDADHVFRSWLETGGEQDLVWDAAIAWLSKHKTEESAVYVTKFIARQNELPVAIIRDILTWCRSFPTNEDALWRLTQLREHLAIPEVAEDVLATAELVLEHLLDQRTYIKGKTGEQIVTVYFNLITAQGMQLGSLRERADDLFVKWIQDERSFGPYATRFWVLQNASFLSRLSDLLTAGVLDPVSDSKALARFMQWLDTWEQDRKQALIPILSDLKDKYPKVELWDLVQTDQGR